MNQRLKKYWQMTKTELAEATKEFDQEFIADKAPPMTPAERAEERRARLLRPTAKSPRTRRRNMATDSN
jgi:hypothetical protein